MSRCNYEDFNAKKKMFKQRGRHRLITAREERLLIRAIPVIRQYDINFTIRKLVEFCGLDNKKASYRTFVRCLTKNGYSYRQTRKKGVINQKDRKQRLRFARKMKKTAQKNPLFWEKDVCFYLDGVSFIHKINPKGEAMKPGSRVWRKRNEGLSVTAKGSKDLAGGKRLHLMVVVSHKAGVLVVEKYENMNGDYFAEFIKRNFRKCIRQTYIPGVQKRYFVMDNCPCQNSAKAYAKLQGRQAKLLQIPPRSPDINCIENIFNVVKKRLAVDAIKNDITKESFESFEKRVIQTIWKVNPSLIKKTISSMPKRMEALIKCKGYKTKY